MPRYALRDVDPYAVTICKQGANRKRMFLRKSADEPNVESPAPTRILKNHDWSAFYCVVAEPGWEEDGGQGSEEGTVDVWADADEIRKAAHRLLKNGAYVNSLHDALAEEGCHIVENAVALADFDVIDPTGQATTIKKDSWYIAIEPSPEFRARVDEGQGTRVALDKVDKYQGAKKCPGCNSKVATEKGTCPNCGHKVRKSHAGEDVKGPVSSLVKHYMKKPHPFRACVRDNTKRFGPDGAKRVCATLKDMGTGTHDWRKGNVKKSDDAVDAYADQLIEAGVDNPDAVEHLTAYMDAERAAHDDKGPLKKVWDALFPGEDMEDDDVDLRKKLPTFNSVMAQRSLDEELPEAFDALRMVVYRAFTPFGEDDDADQDPRMVISASLDEFRDHCLGLLDTATDHHRDRLAKELGSLGITNEEDFDVDRIEHLEQKINDQGEELRKAVGENADATQSLIGLVEKLTDRLAPAKADEDDAEAAPAKLKKAVEDLSDQFGDLAGKLDTVEQGVSALAQGGSSQDVGPDQVRKTNDNPLAGILS
jgi:hypothetical protein